MNINADWLTGLCIGVLSGCGIFLFFFGGSVNVNSYICYQNYVKTSFKAPSMVCFEGEGLNPCSGDSVNQTGLVPYTDIMPYILEDKEVLNISFNGGN